MKSICNKNINLTFLIILICACSSLAGLKSKISAQISRTDQKKVQYGVYIIEAETGKSVFSYNKSKPLIPASNMKLVTTAAALDYLGKDYKFLTKVGICDNKLVIVSSGDPLLGDEKINQKYNKNRYWPLDEIVNQLKKNGQTRIDGIITDTTVFDDMRVHPEWPADQLNKWYACELSGLNFNNNCLDILVQNKSGNVYYSLIPQTSYLKVKNLCKTKSRGNSAVGAYRTNTENYVILKGRVNKSAQFTLAIERPAGFFAYLLAERLIENNISLNGKIVEGPIPPKCKLEILSVYSTKISDVIFRANNDSLGLASEALMKKIGCDRFGYNGSWSSGAQQIARYLEKTGVSSSHFFVSDGSGLSRENRLSAKALVSVMKDVYNDKNKYDIILNSLSVGGVSGTASRWFKNPKYKGRIFVKTGYINGVRSYTGLCRTNKKDYIFSIITNSSNGKSRDAMNNILEALIDHNS